MCTKCSEITIATEIKMNDFAVSDEYFVDSLCTTYHVRYYDFYSNKDCVF